MERDGFFLLVKIANDSPILRGCPDGEDAASAIVGRWVTPILAVQGVEVLECSEDGDDPGPFGTIVGELAAIFAD